MNQTEISETGGEFDKDGIDLNDENNNNVIIETTIDNNDFIESMMVCETLLKEEEDEEEEEEEDEEHENEENEDEEMDNPNGEIVPLIDEMESNCDINLKTLTTSNTTNSNTSNTNNNTNNNNITTKNIINTLTTTTNTTTASTINNRRSHEDDEDDNEEPFSNYHLESAASTSKREPKLIGNFTNNHIHSHNNNNNNTTSTFSVKPENASFQSNQPTFEQQFANIFDDEEMLEVDFTGEDDLLNVGYFCIFCAETFKDRDEARRHYQKHVNYYSMMCSLCGEGATDMQEFVRHHKESHPEAKKGRYKRREQPIINKWKPKDTL